MYASGFMTSYNYIALNERGDKLKGIMEADSSRQVRQMLRDKGLTPLNVAGSQDITGYNRINGIFVRINVRDLALITRQLATLLQAGLPLEEGLSVLSRQTHSSRIRGILLALRTRILEGQSFSQGLAEYVHVFPGVYRATVAAGEQAGRLHEVLNRLADHTEQAYESREKIMLALLYPALLLILSASIVSGLMVYVVPDVIDVFVETGQALPPLTRALIAISGFIDRNGLVLAAVVLLSIVMCSFVLRSPRIRLSAHRQVLRLPVVGRFSKGINCARFVRTLNILFNSGVPLVESLKIAGQVQSNQWMRQQVAEATQKVVEGSSLNAALKQSGSYPPMMIEMIASGEASGELDAMLQRVALDQEREVQTLARVGLGLLEPLMLLLMGLCVLFIVLAVLLPILNLNLLIG